MSNIKNGLPVIFGLIAIGAIIGVVFTTGFNIDNRSNAGEADSEKLYSEVSQVDETETVTNFNPGKMFVNVVKNVRPAIVTIYTTKSVKASDNPWHRFFREFGGPEGREREGTERIQNGLGSGIIVNEDGHILTNNHVINDVDELRVKLVDGREADAEVIGSDPNTEIALIKIDLDDLKSVNLGNSDDVEIGEWVLAIGSPLALNSTVTAGIVSALSRDVPIIRSQNNTSTGIDNYIQTDAAINPGNSGGALVNMKGDVIGVNTAIATPTGNYVGYGFAVPINIAKNVIDDFIKYGEVRRGYLGVYIENMDAIKAKGVGLDKPIGVLVTSVIAGKAADKAGLIVGDVVLEVEGLAVNLVNELQAKVASYDPGEEIEITIWRDEQERKIDVILENIDGDITAVPDRKEPEEKKFEKVGLKVRDLNSNQLSEIGLENGILVQSVERNSKAGRAGLNRNEIIYEVEGEAIDSVDEFEDILGKYESGEVIRLKIRRNGTEDNYFDRLLFMEIP